MKTPLRVALVMLLATALGLTSALQMHAAHGRPLQPDWIALNLSYFYVLALMLPAMRAFGRSHRPRQGVRAALVLVHAAGFAVSWAVYATALAATRHALGLVDGGFGSAVWQYFVWAPDWILIAYGATVAAVWAVESGRDADERALSLAILEADVANAQLGRLRTQLDPDALFGRFTQIAGLVEADPRRAEALLDDLAQTLRQALLPPRGAETEEVDHPARPHR